MIVGGVEVHSTGLAFTVRELRALVKYTAGVALALEESGQVPAEPEPRPFGFRLGADTELAEIVEPDLSEYFEEEEEE